MTRRPAAPFLPLLALFTWSGVPLPGQEQKPRDHETQSPFVVHYDPQGTLLDDALLNGLLAADRYRPILRELLAGTGCEIEASRAFVYCHPPTKQPAGVFASNLHLSLMNSGSIAPELERKIVTRLCALLRDELQARLVDQQQRPLQAALQGLRDQMEKQQVRATSVRRELLQATPLTSTDKLRERATELDRRLRDLELDLRTEQALQELRLKLTAEATQRLKEVSARRHDCRMRLAEAENQLNELYRQSKTAEIAKAAQEKALRETLVELCAREQIAAEHDLEELANQSRGATLKLHELATRRGLTADEIARTLKEVEAGAERAAALVPLERAVAETEAELTLLREQYSEAARRCAAVQPVRVELWR